MILKALLSFGLIQASFAADLYVSQSANGGDTGVDCGNAHSLAWVNTASNWGIGAGKVNPGDTVHLCGTLTNTAGSAVLTIGGSGIPGNPVTILFETGAVLESPFLGGLYSGGINCLSKSNLVVNGGSNGIVRNTDNGTTNGNHQSSQGIQFYSCENVEILNLSVLNIYANGGASPAATDTAGLDTSDILIRGSSTNISIHNCILSAARSGIRVDFDGGAVRGANIYSNLISDHCWGIALTAGSASEVMTNINIYSNEITGWANWQCPADAAFCNNKTDAFHTDGIISYTTPTGLVDLRIYANFIHGDLGSGSPTAFIYPTSSTGAASGGMVWIYNNLLVAEPVTGYARTWLMTAGATPARVYNNTLVGVTNNSNSAIIISGADLVIENNIVANAGNALASYFPKSAVTVGADNNVYFNCNGPRFSFNDGGEFYNWTAWRALGLDAHSITNDPILTSQYRLSAGSPAIGMGTNLSAVFTTDKDGQARGLTWDDGAYRFGAAARVKTGHAGHIKGK